MKKFLFLRNTFFGCACSTFGWSICSLTFQCNNPLAAVIATPLCLLLAYWCQQMADCEELTYEEDDDDNNNIIIS